MFGKTHSTEPRMLISKSGKLNPMFGKEHSALTRQKISDRMSKHPVLRCKFFPFFYNDNLFIYFLPSTTSTS
jgi:hypothetical protein